MAEQVGVIDTSLIRKEEKRKRYEDKERKERHSRRHKERDAYEDLGKKRIPECVLMERQSQRKKEIQKAKGKQKSRAEKYAREAAYAKYSKKHKSSKHGYGGGHYGKDKEDSFFTPRSAFGNGGQYRYKGGSAYN